MKVGDYVRTKDGIIDEVVIDYNVYCYNPNCSHKHVSCKYNYYDEDKIIKSSPNILKLLEPQDLLYIDIDNDFEGGIIVPRIPETLNELNNYIKKIKSGKLILKGFVTHEQLMERMFEVNK